MFYLTTSFKKLSHFNFRPNDFDDLGGYDGPGGRRQKRQLHGFVYHMFSICFWCSANIVHHVACYPDYKNKICMFTNCNMTLPLFHIKEDSVYIYICTATKYTISLSFQQSILYQSWRETSIRGTHFKKKPCSCITVYSCIFLGHLSHSGYVLL